jgi:hypothetical protein
VAGFEGIGDFNSSDPWERYIAHQAAKGNYPTSTNLGPPTMGDHDDEERRQAAYGTYSIVRFRFNEENEIIKTGLSLEEAQEWCKREDTYNPVEGWFDGYRAE